MSRFTSPLLAGLILSGYQLTGHAAGFALSEQSGSGLGNAYAGAAAVAEDASTIYFNPAGMTYIQGRQLVGALHTIRTTGDFDNQGSIAGGGRPLGGEGGDFGGWAFLPNLYYKQDLTEQLKFGIGVGTPFGLKTEYDRNWLGRFQAVKSELKTVNINPSLAWKVNDQWSLGLGFSAMWAEAELTSAVNLGAGESFVRNKGKDWGFGYNLGAIYQVTPDTRLGLAYRSKVEQHLKGDVRSPLAAFNGNPAATLNTDISADITLPETLSFSAFSRLDERWDLLTDITWTRWSQFKELKIQRENGSGTIVGSPVIEHWNNVLRYSVGLNYRYTDTLKLRTGLAYDDEAIDNEHRTARIPGNDRIWLSLGASWQYSPETKLDVGYTHLFIRDARISDDQTPPAAPIPGRGLIAGKYEGSADILSVQLTHNF
ncbi:MAG TPA: outer membrane protein transport protein [Methylophilus sp.]|uniref:OmpP1/FadL family transporter n=1 Tax=Methylophilus sp. TaxID=29541 RepID=UPI002C739EB1|nr:outer membrane protein transport protein [Methylophilus sp.]HSH86407.1 outer membrane protein transport protein [Methylophilus sp.]